MAVYGDITPTQAAHSAKELLKRAIPYMVLEQIGNLKALPSNSTKTINFRRHKLPIPTDATGFVLTEGTTPASKVATMENVDLTLVQYGAVLETTDVVEDTHIDNVLSEYMGLLGENAGQVIELMRWEAIRTGTAANVILAGNVGTEASIVAGLLKADLRAALRSIRANHGRPISQIIKSDVRWGTEAVEAAYVAIVHSDLEGTIRDTFGSSFTPVADYGSGAKVMQGEFGNFENIRFISTALLGKRVGTTGFPTVAAAPTLLSDNGTHANLYDVIVFGSGPVRGFAVVHCLGILTSMFSAILVSR